LPFPDSCFDKVIAAEVMEHVPDDAAILAELARVLRPGATLVAVDGIENDATRAFHVDDIYNPIDPDDLRRWLDDVGFSAVEVSVYDVGWVCRARA
jgi:ubiquinone/menaquinone biosynthesis C-methylase UbiE